MSMKSEERPRIDVLSQPKRIPSEFQEDRRSVYWVDRIPPTPQTEGRTTVIVATPRIQSLSQPRGPVVTYKGDRVSLPQIYSSQSYELDRPSPIWSVSSGAKNARCTPRLEQLGQPKNLNSQYTYDRSAYMNVSPGALNAKSTKRLESLSQPLPRKLKPDYHETEWGHTFPVSEGAKKANITPHVESLAESKKYHTLFRGEKPVQWPVCDAAMKAIATVRLQQMSRPRSRTMIKDDYDPYKVSIASRRAKATPRLEELCLPIPRKVRPKNA